MNQPVQHLNKVPEVAEKLSISEKTVWAWIGARRLAVHRIAGLCVSQIWKFSAFLNRDLCPPWSSNEYQHGTRRDPSRHRPPGKDVEGWCQSRQRPAAH